MQLSRARFLPSDRTTVQGTYSVWVRYAQIVLSYGDSGDILFTGTFDPDGKYSHKLKIKDESLVPCTVAAASAGEVTRSAVKDAPAGCRL
ncbi:MAG: hypothetical protein ACI80V_001007 [Rhodothermales bacterium]|jgi:hypothetical protein